MHPVGIGAPFPAEIALGALVFALGLRHGLDPDHLVAIDGLTRSSRSRWTGFFFSLGHGMVVTLIGVVLALAATGWQPAAWVESFGTLLSICILVALGAANLAMSARTPRGVPVSTVGLRGRWLAQRWSRASHPVVVAAIGAAFAVSFDTLSHALLFSASGATAAGWLVAAALGLVFTGGMVITDALNGWWVARMVGASDARGARASRVMSVTVALLCFALAAVGLARVELPSFVGIGTFAIVVSAWLVARRKTYREAVIP
ncbi:MAG TPA: nickel transporter [Burkholderiales bacterium]|nr:nickel transporter [Burkholderiales bacterium]